MGLDVDAGSLHAGAQRGDVGVGGQLDRPAAQPDAAALRERVAASGAPHEETPEGLLVRDPWDIPLLVVAEG